MAAKGSGDAIPDAQRLCSDAAIDARRLSIASS